MSLYKSIADIGSKFFPKHKLFKYGFNLSPMYQRSTAKITEVSPDLMEIKVKLPLSYKNRNYVNSIFGGSLFSSVDPIPMVQLINLLGDDYVVWDKSAQIFFKRPAKEHVYAEFKVTQEELDDIKTRVKAENEINLEKVTVLKNKSGDKVFCEVHKVIYIADKAYYKSKRRKA
jgi:acyl-coenzyme A thioesterase PaaI-like protein